MASIFESLSWFHSGKMQPTTDVPESFDHRIVYFLLVTFTVTGFLTFSLYVTHFTRLVLSLFILPGRSVCTNFPSSSFYIRLKSSSAPYIRSTLEIMGSCHWSFRWYWERVCDPALSSRLFNSPRLSYCLKARYVGCRNQIEVQHPN